MVEKGELKHPRFSADLKEMFGVYKPVIAMLHLAPLPGQPDFVSMEMVETAAVNDIIRLQKAGLNGLLIENWKKDSTSPFTSDETADAMHAMVLSLQRHIHIPFGLNILNNDYRTAFHIAENSRAAFVQLDVLVDHVHSDFQYSPNASQHPFEIDVDLADLQKMRKTLGLDMLPLFTFIQPKHYKMIDITKPIELSATQAVEAGANALIITKATGVAPTQDLFGKVKSQVGDGFPVGIGSGFSRENAGTFLPLVDFAIVGTDLKIGHVTDNPVDESAAVDLMTMARLFQK